MPTIEEMRKQSDKAFAALAVDMPLNESAHAWRLWEELRDARNTLASALEQLETAQDEIKVLMGMQFPMGDGGWCCGLRDMGIGIHEAGCPVAAALPPAPEVKHE